MVNIVSSGVTSTGYVVSSADSQAVLAGGTASNTVVQGGGIEIVSSGGATSGATVSIQCDGDFMYANGALWTAAHHRVPLLTVMHNNRAYAQEAMNIQALTNRWNRGADRSGIGTALDDPPIDYAKLAQAMGVYSEGPITDPKDLAAALRRAIQVVKRGKPALVDVVTQTR